MYTNRVFGTVKCVQISPFRVVLIKGLHRRSHCVWWCLLGPLSEPVDGAAVDERGEHTASRAEGISYWTHAQHDVQLVLNTAYEVGKYAISGREREREEEREEYYNFETVPLCCLLGAVGSASVS